MIEIADGQGLKEFFKQKRAVLFFEAKWSQYAVISKHRNQSLERSPATRQNGPVVPSPAFGPRGRLDYQAYVCAIRQNRPAKPTVRLWVPRKASELGIFNFAVVRAHSAHSAGTAGRRDCRPQRLRDHWRRPPVLRRLGPARAGQRLAAMNADALLAQLPRLHERRDARASSRPIFSVPSGCSSDAWSDVAASKVKSWSAYAWRSPLEVFTTGNDSRTRRGGQEGG